MALIFLKFSYFCCSLGESSFNITGGDEDIEGGGAPKTFRHPKGGLSKNCWARRGGSKNVYTIKPTGGEGVLLKN